MVEFISKRLDVMKYAPSLRKGALERLAYGGEEIVNNIVSKYYSHNPNGKKAKGWKSRVYRMGENRGVLEITNNVPFAAIEKPYTIRAANKLLAIPQKPALKPDGTKKYPKGPMGYKMFQKGGSNELRPIKAAPGSAGWLAKVDKKTHAVIGKPWWRLVESVNVPANTPGLRVFLRKESGELVKQVAQHFAQATKYQR